MRMNLERLYAAVSERITRLDFDALFQGFAPKKFALYNETGCIFDGHRIEKPESFCANTSVLFQGEHVAIWNVQSEMDPDVFTSKIVHEMFHAFQEERGWNCFANEMEALFRYRYDAENLSIRLCENERLLALAGRFDEAAYHELLSYRKYRSERFPYEFQYESRVEEIEGTANYVEWKALGQLDPDKADALLGKMRETMLRPESFFPIRISNYYTGACMTHAMHCAGVDVFSDAERPKIATLLKGVTPAKAIPAVSERVVSEISNYEAETKRIVTSARTRNEVVLNGPKELCSVNVYDARHYEDCITSRFFLMYREDGKEMTIDGDFVIRMKDERTIDTVYRWVD